MRAAQPVSGAAGQPGAAATAPSPAAGTGLEEGCDEDLFLQLAAAAEEDDDSGAAAGGSGATASQPSKSGGSSGPRLSWAAKAATAGIAGAVPPGHKPRQAVVLAPGAIPRVAPPPPSALLPLPASQAAAAPIGRGVATFGAPAASAGGAGGAAKGGFADVGQGSLVERYAGLKVRELHQSVWCCVLARMLCGHSAAQGWVANATWHTQQPALLVCCCRQPTADGVLCGLTSLRPCATCGSFHPLRADQEPSCVAHPAARPAGRHGGAQAEPSAVR